MARRSAKLLAAVAASAICGSALAQIPPSLPAASSVAGTDLFNVWQTNTTRTASSTQIVASGLSSGLNATPVGNTTPSTGAFTTLSASGTVSGAGFTSLFASPPSIGSTAPGTGAFTTLSATSAVSGAGITSLFASPPSIGSTAAGSGSFTTLSASGPVSGTGFANRFSSPGPIGNTSASTGAFTTLSSTGAYTPSSTNGIVGTTAGDNANAGSIGEYFQSSAIICTTNTGLSNSTPTNVASLALTAGDWEVDGVAGVDTSVSNALTSLNAGINITSATFLNAGSLGRVLIASASDSNVNIVPTGNIRLSASTPFTAYLIVQGSISSGTMGLCGQMEARRVR